MRPEEVRAKEGQHATQKASVLVTKTWLLVANVCPCRDGFGVLFQTIAMKDMFQCNVTDGLSSLDVSMGPKQIAHSRFGCSPAMPPDFSLDPKRWPLVSVT